MKIQKNPRTYISPELNIKSFEELLPYLNELSSREINSKEAFLTWLSDKSELDAVLEEDQAWRYIKMSIDTKNKDHADSYNFFVTEIQPKLAPFDDLLNNKLSESDLDIKEKLLNAKDKLLRMVYNKETYNTDISKVYQLKQSIETV